jgi:hypothetical protein
MPGCFAHHNILYREINQSLWYASSPALVTRPLLIRAQGKRKKAASKPMGPKKVRANQYHSPPWLPQVWRAEVLTRPRRMPPYQLSLTAYSATTPMPCL